ncbi:2048_t:CDS:2 [Entrophospora sp. SA101]|nr:2048_t:CDS:2 [Entrophospora sp. SA101]
MSDVEVVNLERIQHGFKNFDVVLIFKDCTRPPIHINTIPMHQLEDPVGFYNNGGWSFLHEKDSVSVSCESSSDDYEESGGSDESGDERKRKHSIDATTGTNKKLHI